jgi:hypothetical protein
MPPIIMYRERTLDKDALRPPSLSGNAIFQRTTWWGWEDSNFQPNDYQPLELNHSHLCMRCDT